MKKEFTIALSGYRFLFELFTGKDGKLFLYVNMHSVNGDKGYFFMVQNNEGAWVIPSTLTVSAEILEIEAALSQELAVIMTGYEPRTSL